MVEVWCYEYILDLLSDCIAFSLSLSVLSSCEKCPIGRSTEKTTGQSSCSRCSSGWYLNILLDENKGGLSTCTLTSTWTKEECLAVSSEKWVEAMGVCTLSEEECVAQSGEYTEFEFGYHCLFCSTVYTAVQSFGCRYDLSLSFSYMYTHTHTHTFSLSNLFLLV